MEDGSEHKKDKGTKKWVIKGELMFGNYKNCVLNDKVILEKNKKQAFSVNVSTVENNKVALSSNDGKRLQTFDKITTYPRGADAFKVCKNEMMMVTGNFVKNYTD